MGYGRCRIGYSLAGLLPCMELSLPCAYIAEDGRVVINLRAVFFIYPYTEEGLPVPVFKFPDAGIGLRVFDVKRFTAAVRALKMCHQNFLVNP